MPEFIWGRRMEGRDEEVIGGGKMGRVVQEKE
jgi:hypothetical protein